MVSTFAESFERFLKARLGPDSRCLVVGEKDSLDGFPQGQMFQYALEPEVVPTGFSATHVCVSDLKDEMQLKSWLSFLKGQAQGAELIFSMANGSSASNLLKRCLEQESGVGVLNATQVRSLLVAEGFKVQAEAWKREEPEVEGLALSTTKALRSVLAELQPRSVADQIFLVAVPTSKRETRLPWEDGLLTVVVTARLPEQMAELEETLLALVGQDYQPVEVCVVCEDLPGQDEARKLLQTYERFLRFQSRVVSRAVLAKAGMRGQFVAFVSAGTLVYPRHFVRLIEALSASGRAWALARGRHVEVAGQKAGWIETKVPYPAERSFDFHVLQQEGALLPGAVLDRARIGAFSLDIPEDAYGKTGASLLLRLGSLFAPCFLAQTTSFELSHSGEVAPPTNGMALLSLSELNVIAKRVEQDAFENRSLKALGRVGKQGMRKHVPRLYAQLKRWTR